MRIASSIFPLSLLSSTFLLAPSALVEGRLNAVFKEERVLKSGKDVKSGKDDKQSDKSIKSIKSDKSKKTKKNKKTPEPTDAPPFSLLSLVLLFPLLPHKCSDGKD